MTGNDSERELLGCRGREKGEGGGCRRRRRRRLGVRNRESKSAGTLPLQTTRAFVLPPLLRGGCRGSRTDYERARETDEEGKGRNGEGRGCQDDYSGFL